jgi:lipopolysaccharide export system ATP-binding protein
MATLRTEQITKSYRGRQVLKGIDLQIHDREVVGLLGPNGAGKTTTFYIIVGLTLPDSGRVFYNNEDIAETPMYMRAKKGISYLPQEPSVFRKLTVEENLLAIAEILDLGRTRTN